MPFSFVLQQAPRIENRALLDLAHRVKNCVNCGIYMPEGCNPCHSNSQAHGRGKDYKSHDNHHFAGCNDCHRWYDEGTKEKDPTDVWEPTREDKAQFFLVMQDRTMDLYWRSGWILVKKP